MQPVKMVIPGEYWDSFIYKGRLYLFGMEGDIRSIGWDEFVSEWQVPEESRIAFVCAYLRSDYLYSSEVQDLLRDSEVRPIIRRKFETLSKMELHASEAMLRRFQKGHQQNPIPFPHADIEIYTDQLFVGSAHGLYQATCNRRNKYPVSTRPKKKWDGPVLSMSASYGALALAAGREGLFEHQIDSGYRFGSNEDARQISGITCRDCSWAFYSIFASSDSSGYLAEFSRESDGLHLQDAGRKFEGIETAEQIFGAQGYSWGVQDKLCQVRQNAIRVVKYEPWKRDESPIRELGDIRFESWKGEIVSACTTNFGMIVELENALVVFPSDGRPVTIPGEPVNWRVFPRSRRYENQLHVCYEGRMEIYSFNHDYLVDQQQKLSGFTVFGQKGNRRSRVDPLIM